jgi:hypothetical protein
MKDLKDIPVLEPDPNFGNLKLPEVAPKYSDVELAMAAYRHVRAEWIEEHGSERLKLAAKLGLLDKSDNVYREERLGAEKPGWKFEHSMPIRFRVSKIHNPTLAALKALEHELEVATAKTGEIEPPTIKLVYIEWKEERPSAMWGRKSTINLGREALTTTFIGLPVYRWIDGRS